MRSLFKNCYYGLWTPHLLKQAKEDGAIIGLSYHRFEQKYKNDPRPNMAIVPETFIAQLECLMKIGRFISLDDIYEDYSEGIKFVLSFDDGYADNHDILLPVLERLQIPASIFAVANYVNGELQFLPHDAQSGHWPDALTPAQLKALSAHELISIGAHTLNHPILSELSPEEQRTEIIESKKALEELTGAPVKHFAPPSGQPADVDWDILVDACFDAGYKTISSNFGGINIEGKLEQLARAGAHLTHIRRIPMPVHPGTITAKGWALGMHNLKERFHPTAHFPHRKAMT